MKKKVVMIALIAAFSLTFHMSALAGTMTRQATKDKYSASDLRYLTSIIYCEARGEGYEGQKAVGIVVMNRVESELFPDDICSVIYDSGQFAPVYNGSLSNALGTYDYEKSNGEFDKTMQSCFEAAEEVLEGSREISVGEDEQDMSDYLFFSCYIPNARFYLGNHDFK